MSGTHLKGTLRGHEGCGPHTVRARTHAQRDSYSNGEHSHYQLSYSSVGSESAPHCYKSPFAHGFELSRRRKKRPVGTWRNSTYEWAPT